MQTTQMRPLSEESFQQGGLSSGAEKEKEDKFGLVETGLEKMVYKCYSTLRAKKGDGKMEGGTKGEERNRVSKKRGAESNLVPSSKWEN